jgi:asparagine synthase (glutamine-hydrolysing)
MSGILGVIQFGTERLSADTFNRMLDALSLRGPDKRGIWQNHFVRLGHRHLFTTPEARSENLPSRDETTRNVITSDCRLDNRNELIQAIGREQFNIESIPDSLILLKAYQKWGNDCVTRLLGDFSFAIWNEREQELFCARDFLGVKPFYYCQIKGLFLFCSESPAIVQYSDLPFSINLPRIAESLTPHLEGYDTTSTFYREIFRLPPAHTLTFKHGHIQRHCYWHPEPQKNSLIKTDGEYREALTDLLHQAVADRNRGIDAPAVMLSGGVDSALIMALAQQQCKESGRRNLQTFSGISERIEDCIESRMISLLTTGHGSHSTLKTPQDLTKQTSQIFKYVSRIQEPFDMCMILHFLLYHQASNNGHRVVLDGVDGDIAASLGSNYPSLLLRQFNIKAGLHESISQSKIYNHSFPTTLHCLLRYMASALTPHKLNRIRHKHQLPGISKQIIKESIISSSFAQKTDLNNRLITFSKAHQTHGLSSHQEMYLSRIQHPFLTVGLERYDRVASLCSLEPRHPLLDKRIVDFYCELPWNQFVRNGRTKYLLRNVAQQFLPQEVCWRTEKQHVGWQFIDRFLKSNSDRLSDAINQHYCYLQDIVTTRQSLQNSELCGNDNVYDWQFVGLTLWLSNNLDVMQNESNQCESRK